MNVRTEAILRVLIAAGFVAVGAIGALGAREFTDVGRWFPYYTSLGIVVLATFILGRELITARAALGSAPPTGKANSPAVPVNPVSAVGANADKDDSMPQDDAEAQEYLEERQPLGKMLVWWVVVAIFTAFVYLFGLIAVAPVFILLALRYSAGTSWRSAVLAAIVGTGVIFGLHEVLQLPLPPSILLD